MLYLGFCNSRFLRRCSQIGLTMATFSAGCNSGPSEPSKFGNGSTSLASNSYFPSRFQENFDSTNTLPHPSDSGPSSPESDDETFYISNFKYPSLNYISDFLLGNDEEEMNSMLENSLVLRAAEKSFFDVLHPTDAPSSNLPLPVYQNFEYLEDSSHTMKKSSLAQSFPDNPSVSDSLIIDEERHQEGGLKGKKINRQREDGHNPEEGRSSKQLFISADDSELRNMFDKVLVFQVEYEQELESCTMKNVGTEQSQHIRQSKGSKKTRSQLENKDVEVDLTTMLNNCAQAVASYDHETASELLKKIRQHSSPEGHATQRLAHYFANGLEARLSGVGTPSYTPLFSRHTPPADILQAHKVLTTSTPFKAIANFLANRKILNLAENETRLHIIDFGIGYGIQWPYLIHHLSKRPTGPPKLRITGIEFPQSGFRPAERVEETGRCLARYCAKLNVPFEYNAIAQKWETITLEDLEIVRNELTVVNCLRQLEYVHDESVMENSPRDAVLKLIKSINPAIFIHGITNGTYNTPFFATRFKEALWQYYAAFEMLEATNIPREDKWRLMLEKEIHGRDIMNIIACEGVARMFRPETYKKWQIRNVRAGLKQIPLNKELLEEARKKSKFMGYHKRFTIDEDRQWMLHGWKGRISTALSFWKAASVLGPVVA